ncbi:MAG TPA: winged helix-turn-helix domain-containing protein [Candidatus Baltobacteraceae bacterium]|nr:winged helix-turn-helix domain-containing protein [Candidatus Baltobacteraceae bacterium]
MDQILFGDFVLNVSERTLHHRRALVVLRPKEFDLLLLLASFRGAIVRKTEIMDVVWGDAEVSDAALTQCMHRLRRTLAVHDPHTQHVVTIQGLGYRLTSLRSASTA